MLATSRRSAALSLISACVPQAHQPRAASAAEEVTAALRQAFSRAMDAGDGPDAEEAWTECIKLAPSNPAVWANRGASRLQRRQWNGAYSDLLQASNLESSTLGQTEPLTLNNLGNVSLALGKQQEALRYFESAARDRDLEEIALANLASAQFESGDTDAAIRTASRVVCPLRLLHSLYAFVQLQTLPFIMTALLVQLKRDPSFLDMRALLVALYWSDPSTEGQAEQEWQRLCDANRANQAARAPPFKVHGDLRIANAQLTIHQCPSFGLPCREWLLDMIPI